MDKSAILWVLAGLGIYLFFIRKKAPLGSGSGFGVGGTGRLGAPKTDEERRSEHLARHGSEVLPARGTGLTRG